MDKSRGKYKIWISCAMVLVLLVCIFVYNFISINTKYPDRREEYYSIGDTFIYNDVSITVNDCTLFDSDEFETQILKGKKSSIWGNDLGPWKELLLIIRLENLRNEVCVFDCSSLLIQSGSWWNGLDSLTFMELNGVESSLVQIQPRNSCDLYFPVNLLEMQFRTNDWLNLKDREFELIGSVYPVTQVVKMTAENAQN